MSQNKISLSVGYLSTIFIVNNLANFISLLTIVVAQRLMTAEVFNSFGFFTSTINHIGIFTNIIILIIGSGFDLKKISIFRKKIIPIFLSTMMSIAALLIYLCAHLYFDLSIFMSVMIIWSIFLSVVLAVNMGQLLTLGRNIQIAILQLISSILKFCFTVGSVISQFNVILNSIFFLSIAQIIAIVFSYRFLAKKSDRVDYFKSDMNSKYSPAGNVFLLIFCLLTLSLFGYIDLLYLYLHSGNITVGQFVVYSFLGKSIGLAFVGVTNAGFGQFFNKKNSKYFLRLFKEFMQKILPSIAIICLILISIADLLLHYLFDIEMGLNFKIVYISLIYSSMLPVIWIWIYFLFARGEIFILITRMLIPSWVVIFSCSLNWVGNLSMAMLAILLISTFMLFFSVYTAFRSDLS